jgi:hypothetical protein
MPRRRTAWLVACVALFLLGAQCLEADPIPSPDQFAAYDQGSVIMVTWHFYPKFLPAKFTVPETTLPVALDDPATLKATIAELARASFSFSLDGAPLALRVPPDVSIAPDGGCVVRMLYPGRKNGRLVIRNHLTPVYPPAYVMDYRVFSPINRAHCAVGYFKGGGASPAVDYTQAAADAKPTLLDWFNATPVRLFAAELRTAWINPNWLLLVVLLALTRPAREIVPLVALLVGAWLVPCFFWNITNRQIPVTIPPAVAGVVTALLGALLLVRPPPLRMLGGLLVGAGIFNSCFDIQQTSLERPEADIGNLLALGLGFAVGLGFLVAVTVPILGECRKFPGFERTWAPRVGWALAAVALAVPWVPG